MNAHTAFFGDGDRAFALPAELIVELERKTDAGIGTLCLRVVDGHFRHDELMLIIRLALIGGGTDPQEAAALVAAYAVNQPLSGSFALATKILQIVWSGPPAPATQEAGTDGQA